MKIRTPISNNNGTKNPHRFIESKLFGELEINDWSFPWKYWLEFSKKFMQFPRENKYLTQYMKIKMCIWPSSWRICFGSDLIWMQIGKTKIRFGWGHKHLKWKYSWWKFTFSSISFTASCCGYSVLWMMDKFQQQKIFLKNMTFTYIFNHHFHCDGSGNF